MTDRPDEPIDADRLRERVAALEEDRARLMASIRHMRCGRLDGSYLTDALRAELARSPRYGLLLETIETEIRRCRGQLGE